MIIDKNDKTIKFEFDSDLDHVVTGYDYNNLEEMMEKSKERLKYEAYCKGFKKIDSIEKFKCLIPKNSDIKELNGWFNSFSTLIKTLYRYRNNKKVFPYNI